jgi:integrase
MGRRANGEGSLYQRQDGRWVASLQVDGRRVSAYGRTRQEARAKLKALREQVYTAPAPPSRHTLAYLLDTWLTNDPSLKETTRISHRAFMRLYVLPTLGETRIDRIAPTHLQALYAPLSPAVVDKVHRILHRAFAVAIRWRWLTENPCQWVLRPRYEAARRPLWSEADLHAFLNAIEGYWLEPLFILLLSSGLRIGETLALMWTQVGPDTVRVQGTLYYVEGEARISPPKTSASRRTVHLPPVAIAALNLPRAQQTGWREAARERWVQTPFVFTRRTGQPVQNGTVFRALRRYCAQLGIPSLSPHGLRHLHASLLIEQGVPIPAVGARLGHANASITLRIYAHALPGQDDQAADAIARALSRQDGSQSKRTLSNIRATLISGPHYGLGMMTPTDLTHLQDSVVIDALYRLTLLASLGVVVIDEGATDERIDGTPVLLGQAFDLLCEELRAG